MTTQAFLVCEVIYTGWKQIPGSFCILPRFVSISLVVSKLSCSLVLPSARCSFIDLILCDGHIRRDLGCYALDGSMANPTAFSSVRCPASFLFGVQIQFYTRRAPNSSFGEPPQCPCWPTIEISRRLRDPPSRFAILPVCNVGLDHPHLNPPTCRPPHRRSFTNNYLSFNSIPHCSPRRAQCWCWEQGFDR